MKLITTDFESRDTDPDERMWKFLGYGRKTANVYNWRYWSEAKGQGPWLIVAPREMATYRLVDKELWLDGEAIYQGRTQWEATWYAVAHFHREVLPKLVKSVPLTGS